MCDATILVYCSAAYFPAAFGFGEPVDRVTYDKSAIFTAKCVVFHIPTLTDLDYRSLPWLHARKQPGQVWVMFSAESAVNYPAMSNPEFTRMFDLEMSYRQSADVWTPYLDTSLDADLRAATVLPKRHFAAAFISSAYDRSGRAEYLSELMKYMPVHSYGKLLNNRTGADLGQGAGIDGARAKLQILSHYRFSLAFENSIATDYVTEKFYQPLRVGSIPVYLGAANISEFAPAPGSYVDVTDFSDPKALAAHLLALDEQDCQQWRRQPQSAALTDKLSRLACQQNTFAALCQKINQVQS